MTCRLYLKPLQSQNTFCFTQDTPEPELSHLLSVVYCCWMLSHTAGGDHSLLSFFMVQFGVLLCWFICYVKMVPSQKLFLSTWTSYINSFLFALSSISVSFLDAVSWSSNSNQFCHTYLPNTKRMPLVSYHFQIKYQTHRDPRISFHKQDKVEISHLAWNIGRSTCYQMIVPQL